MVHKKEDNDKTTRKKDNPLIPHIVSMLNSASDDQLRIVYRFVLTLTQNNRN